MCLLGEFQTGLKSDKSCPCTCCDACAQMTYVRCMHAGEAVKGQKP